MRIIISKELIPKTRQRLDRIKLMENYQFEAYKQDGDIIVAPSNDLPLELINKLVRAGLTVEGYEYWVEVPDVNLNDNLPSGLSYETYLDDQEPPIEQTRTWADLGELSANFAGTATMRYWQAANDGQFSVDDVEIIQEAGFELFTSSNLNTKLNQDYQDTGDPEYTESETIEFIDQQWAYAGYLDKVHALLRMQEVYEAKGATDLDRWNACTTAEQRVLVEWNLVGLNRADDLVPPAWSEARGLKELGKAYREFEYDMRVALENRFKDWFAYLNMTLSGAGRTKFESDWDWNLKQIFIHQAYRFYELGSTNDLIDWHDTTLATYIDADFIGTTITANQIIANLRKVLADKEYII